MEILKFHKKKSNQYELILENNSILLYDETILKYNLLLKKEIPESLFGEIEKYDALIRIYYKIVKSLKYKRKTEQEIRKVFIEANANSQMTEDLINKLKEAGLINDIAYLNAYIHDAIFLKNLGPRKIETDLLALGFNLSSIRDEIAKYDEDVWIKTIDKIIEKKLKVNHHDSSKVVKLKLATFIVHAGFTKEMTIKELDRYEINDSEALKKAFIHQKKVLEKKYSGEELKFRLKQKLMDKGFCLEKIAELIK